MVLPKKKYLTAILLTFEKLLVVRTSQKMTENHVSLNLAGLENICNITETEKEGLHS